MGTLEKAQISPESGAEECRGPPGLLGVSRKNFSNASCVTSEDAPPPARDPKAGEDQLIALRRLVQNLDDEIQRRHHRLIPLRSLQII
jgi:hypothetical protein